MKNTWFDRSCIPPEIIKNSPFLCDHAILCSLRKKYVTVETNINETCWQQAEWKTYFPRGFPRIRDIFIIFILFQSRLSVFLSRNTKPVPRNTLNVFPFPGLISWSISYFIILKPKNPHNRVRCYYQSMSMLAIHFIFKTW